MPPSDKGVTDREQQPRRISRSNGISRHEVGASATNSGEDVRKTSAGEGNKARQGARVIEMQRRRLLSAMVEVLDVQGYEGATVARICKRAGVSRRTFYDLFDDREECLIGAFELTIDRLAEPVAFAYATKRNARPPHHWRERTRASLVVLLDFFDDEPGLARLCLVETLKGGPEILRRRRDV